MNKTFNFINSIEEKLVEPVQYYYGLSGKNIRKIIANELGILLNISEHDIEDISKFIDIMHNCSLVIDDIQDNSTIRRNNVCAHIKYGTALSLNGSYLTVFKTLNELNKNKNISIDLKFKIIDYLYLAHIGQGMDIYYTQNKIIPTIEEYYTMIKYNTGILFLGILDFYRDKIQMSDEKYSIYYKIFQDFSYYFQIRDDYINLTDPDYWKEKGFCQDIDEQKISFLITYAYNNKFKNYKKILKLLEKKEKEKIVLLFYENGLFNKIYSILNELKIEIFSFLKNEQFNERFNEIIYNMLNKTLPIKPFDINSLNEFKNNTI